MLRQIEEAGFSNGSVPFVSDFVKQTGLIDEASFICTVKPSPNGLFVVCEKFKGVLFKQSSLHGFLLDALKHYTSPGVECFALYGIACEDGKLRIAVDDEYTAVSWINKAGLFTQKKLDDQDASLIQTASNPLIPSPTASNAYAGNGTRTTGTQPRSKKNS